MSHTIRILLAVSLLATPAWAQQITNTYDDAGRLTAIEYENGTRVEYDYDVAGNILERRVVVPEYTLAVASAGTGTGTVTSTPAGIDCGATCAADFDMGTVVSLAASPTADSDFAGWSGGGCSGTGACAVIVDSDTTVTATFTQVTFTVTASAGTGGSISPSGAVVVPRGDDVDFTITPDSDYLVDDVLVDGSSIGAVTSHSITNVTADHTIAAQFEAAPAGDPPTAPLLVSPANGATGVATPVTFQWQPSTDPDGGTITYDLYYCEDSSFAGCAPQHVASLWEAADWRYGSVALLLLGLLGLRRRRSFVVALLLVVGLSFNAACTSDDGPGQKGDAAAPGDPAPTGVAYEASGLNSGTTYYWKVVAIDDEGATAESSVWSFTTE